MFDYSKYGFSNGDKTELKRVLEDKIEFESVSIDTYIARPYTFILRSSEKNVTASLEDDRVIIRRNDCFKTTISNFSFDSVCDVQFLGVLYFLPLQISAIISLRMFVDTYLVR